MRVDFLVPEEAEYTRLVKFMTAAGYKQVTGYGWQKKGEAIIFDLYVGNSVYSTELLSSPLEKGGHQKLKEWNKIYLGALNPVDLIISKMFRGSEVDVQDSLALLKHEKISIEELKKRYIKTAKYDVSEDRVLKNLDTLLRRL